MILQPQANSFVLETAKTVKTVGNDILDLLEELQDFIGESSYEADEEFTYTVTHKWLSGSCNAFPLPSSPLSEYIDEAEKESLHAATPKLVSKSCNASPLPPSPLSEYIGSFPQRKESRQNNSPSPPRPPTVVPSYPTRKGSLVLIPPTAMAPKMPKRNGSLNCLTSNKY
jgi:hypothetical protein